MILNLNNRNIMKCIITLIDISNFIIVGELKIYVYAHINCLAHFCYNKLKLKLNFVVVVVIVCSYFF